MSTNTDREAQTLWHPFADMSKVIGGEIEIDRGEGVWVYDRDGRRYLDASAGLWYCNIGHGRAEIAEAAAAQMRRLAGYQIFDRFTNRPALDLADRVAGLVPIDGAAVFFTNGGSDAIDSAGKIARRYWELAGEPQRRTVVHREGAYHGMNAFGTSLSGIPANSAGWGPLVADTVSVPRDDVDALAEALERAEGTVAAVIGEPVQGAAGVFPPAPGYWPAVQQLCREHGVLLVADEVVTGLGRVGSWFASERYGLTPDLILTAKGLSSGYLPIGAVVASPRITDVLWSADAGAFRHGYTYSGHPAACAAALANLDLLEAERVLDNVVAMEPVLARLLAPLGDHELVAAVRTAGLLAGVELSEEALAAAPDAVERVVVAARSRGVLVRNLVGRTLQISPPLVIGTDELELLAAALGDALDEVGTGLRLDGERSDRLEGSAAK